MNTPKHTIGNVTFSGASAESADKITNEEWAYFDLVDGLTDMISVYMDDCSMKKAELARKLGKSRAFVSKVLAGDAHNMTLKTLANLIYHLGARLEYKVVPNEDAFRWIGVSHDRQDSPRLMDWNIPYSATGCGGSLFTASVSEKESLAA